MVRRIDAIFRYLWVLTFGLTLLDTLFYPGFVIKHLGFNPVIAVGITAVLMVWILILRFARKDKADKKTSNIGIVFFVFVLACYTTFKIANRLLYPNFVFSKLHIQPDPLVWPVVVSFFPVVVNWIPKIDFKKFIKFHFIILALTLMLTSFNIYKSYKKEWWAASFIISHPGATYADKMRRAVGPVFYDFTVFVNKYTPEDAVLLIPPQAFPWPQTGNGAYMRYFVYPRDIGNSGEYALLNDSNLDNYDYVLLAWGETPTTQDKYTHGWPKFDVPAEKVIFMNTDGSFGGEKRGDYHYKDYIGREVWGVIKIKH